MNSADHSQDATWRNVARRFQRELVQALQLRRDLAALEVRQDRQLIRRCLIAGGVGAVMALVGLPLLLQIAAQKLADVTVLSVTAWTLILGSILLVPGLLLVARAILRFRSDFRGLRNTLAELNEDLVWLREWMPGEADERSASAAPDDEAN